MTASSHQLRGSMLACSVVLCLGVVADTMRDLMPPPPPKFTPPVNALFVDDFRSGKLDHWRADRPDVWSTRRGMLVAQLPDEKQQHSFLYAGDEDWTDYAVDLDVCGIRGVDKGLVVRVRGDRGVGIDLRGPGYHDLKVQLNEFPVARVDVQNGNSQWHHVHVEIQGARLRIVVNGDEVVNRRLSARVRATGGIALAAYTGGIGECTVYYDNVAVTPLQPTGKRQRATRVGQ